jgi:hypothetical protein
MNDYFGITSHLREGEKERERERERERKEGRESSVCWQKFGDPEAKKYLVTKPGFPQIQQALDKNAATLAAFPLAKSTLLGDLRDLAVFHGC